MTALVLSAQSLAERKGLHADGVAVVQRMAALRSQVFATLDVQRQLLAVGASQAPSPRRLVAHGVERLPPINGSPAVTHAAGVARRRKAAPRACIGGPRFELPSALCP